MTYIDGFVTPVPTASKAEFIKAASVAGEVFKEHGATELVECWGDDVADGELTSLPKAVNLEEGETVVFSWVVWPSRDIRDEAMPKIMADPRVQPDVLPMPFDEKRMIFGSFVPVVGEAWPG